LTTGQFLPHHAIRRARCCYGKSSVCLSVCPWRWGIVVSWSHTCRLEFFETNFTVRYW